MAAEELFSAPSDLTLSSDEDLAALEGKAVAEFNRVNESDAVDPETLQYAMRLTDDLDRIRGELRVREVRAEQQASLQQSRVAEQLSQLQARVNGAPAAQAAAEHAPQVDAEAIAQATAQGVTAALSAFMLDRSGGRVRPDEIARRATASLAETAQHAPTPQVPTQRLAITASVDIPGVARGEGLSSLTALADVTARKAKSMPVTSGQPSEQLVASIRNDFSHSVDNRTTRGEMKDLISYLTGPDKQAALVAGGGWCAPSETRYDFFNIACEDGMIDLPTFGVTRGGISYPVSPSLADALAGGTAFAGFAATLSNTSTPFLWTEADDIAAATGSPTKPCVRVPCPDFDEERLEAYGYCLTAGNLTDDAYPEATQNTLQLLMAAHAHVINARLIALMLARSTAATSVTGGAVTDAAAPRIYNAVGMAATDYRARYGMCIDDVLEVVFPYWVRDVIQADLAWKAGVELGDIPLSEVNRYFTARNIAVQWVNDWQVRGASQFGNATKMTAWPTTVDFLIYAAGTFIHGNGMSLDLGVIRDSVLNETNDHTAAWSEEAHLIAKVGHESRRYTVGFNVNGSTSALLTGTVRV
ncbi:major capsid protein [Streptomyces europaeiscabiei]|uniref:Major capsid protein n=1 Tax=Streptomyces europaeiscabiei TaxID=146819 RepID=A0ABU4NWD7_9ACTN|nr:major capsid protein [Streptomyces europaeiscabiei]MDX2759129.1 major capsid protein [Streptomyces europaeiscabiei]MDX3549755.1 major capsid protein [Streptomyces europaeiscabiei]MDX3558771.1 major capsid protein [Streptomyces europaeiscabiei]MDX3707096.1 major capsid protein [Streptomyces europaeiscabiei]